ncbi:MAG TPA: VCBS domain-containing protein, partial [Pseudomonadales bacterium]|nr:VCBS domain-containing protein [Pseudomonadales bacterium]
VDNAADELFVTNVTVDNGTITNNGDGTFTYTPDPDFNGDVVVSFEVSDGELTDTGSTTFTVVPIVDIVNDGVEINEDTPVIINVMGNDTFEGEGTVTSVSDPTNGTATVNADNTVTYIPDQDFVGEDSFTYTVTTETGNTETATVTVTIVSSDNPANLGTDSGEVTEGGPLTDSGTISIDDPDAGENVFQVQNDTQGNFGSFDIDENGNWTYTLDDTLDEVQSLGEGDQLTEIFPVLSADGTETSVVITINGTNDVPVFTPGSNTVGDDAGTVKEEEPLQANGTIEIDDVDTGEDMFQSQDNTEGEYGDFTVDEDGNWTYNLDNGNETVQSLPEGETLTETFPVTSVDGTETEVVITIVGTNDVPTITGDVGSVTEDTVLSTSGTVTIVDTDAGESEFAPQTGTTGNHGTFTLTANGAWVYTLDNDSAAVQALGEGDTLTDVFTVTSADGSGSETVTITINGTNDTPTFTEGNSTIGDDAGVVTEDATLTATGTVAITDTDADEAFFQPETDKAGDYGSLTIDENGNWTYTLDNANTDVQALNAGEQLDDSFTVTSADGTETTVAITINGTNDVPTITTDPQDGAVEEDVTLTATGTVTSHDIDTSATATFTGDATGTYGSFAIDAQSGEWTYTFDNEQSLAAGETHTETFTVTVTDDQGATATQDVTITLTGTNDAPVITSAAQTGAVEEDVTLSATGTVTASDVDNNASATFSGDATGTYGSFAIDATTGEWTYTFDNEQSLAAGETHTETFTVTVTDDQGDTATQDVTITLTGTNDAPVITSAAQTGTVEEDVTLSATGTV